MASSETHRDQLRRIATRHKIAQRSDVYFGQAQALADLAVGADLRTSQVRNLETLAYSTDKVSDLLDLVKKQTGRSRSGKGWRYQDLGESLLNALAELKGDAQEIGQVVGQAYAPLPEDYERQVHLELCREYLKHLAAHYLYSRPEGE